MCLSLCFLVACTALLSTCTGRRTPSAPAPSKRLFIGYASPTGQDVMLQGLTTDGLLQTTADGRHEPRLAESWSIEDEGRVVVVKLREGVTFHDGVALDADVVKDFFDAARTDARQLRDHPALGDIETIEVLWVDLLRIQLRQPTPFLLDDLAIRIERPVDGRLTGTGPFARQDQREDAFTLVANPTYYRGRPSIDQVSVRTYPTVRTAWAAMMRGEIDFLFDVPMGARELVEAESSVNLFMTDRPYALAIAFNVRHETLASTLVRRALNHAVDRQLVIEHALRGDGQPASGIWPRHWAYGGVEKLYPYDPGLADQLLTDAGYPPAPSDTSLERMPARFRFTCLVREGDMTEERVALLVQRQLYDIGVEMQIEALGIQEFTARVTSRAYDAALVPQNLSRALSRLYVFWHSSQAYALFGYTAADAVLSDLRYAATDDEVTRAAWAFQTILYDDPPAIFLAVPRRARAVSRRFDVPAVPGEDVMETVWRWRRTVPGE